MKRSPRTYTKPSKQHPKLATYAKCPSPLNTRGGALPFGLPVTYLSGRQSKKQGMGYVRRIAPPIM